MEKLTQASQDSQVSTSDKDVQQNINPPSTTAVQNKVQDKLQINNTKEMEKNTTIRKSERLLNLKARQLHNFKRTTDSNRLTKKTQIKKIPTRQNGSFQNRTPSWTRQTARPLDRQQGEHATFTEVLPYDLYKIHSHKTDKEKY